MKSSIPHYYLYGEDDPVNELEFLHIETIAERNHEHHWEIEAHRHDSLGQLLFVREGYIEATLDTEQHHCYGPAIVWVPPTIVHGFRPKPGTQGHVLTLAESFLLQVLSTAEREEFPQLMHTPLAQQLDTEDHLSTELSRLVRSIEQEFRWPKAGRVAMISAYLKALIINIGRLELHQTDRSSDASPQVRTFENFRKLVEHHFKEHWSVQQYAQQLGMTESRLNSLCRKVVDLSPSQIIHKRLVMEAKRILVYTSMPVSTIAYELGFKDPAYFSRYFAKQTGEAASQFREKYVV
ncbi:helix-turn-helix domain-containing protein [Pseudomaricurvus alkylphenolicus]|jgi:AraC family transcriptional activator of pobA|uniref:helix-turn-helix domain-containing protein n=1 Tax=Pseudomaricurvus alkylphenolicus TaxID=1306991 RepID=UPI001422DE45|nr:helix-turn-helix domain-containing protein [Pseudomaricurvus alkylphenolicus]NIB38518.1 helix-turn-helix domain-containing protein [Pseudomaricurvus alkylphenolicus]